MSKIAKSRNSTRNGSNENENKQTENEFSKSEYISLILKTLVDSKTHGISNILKANNRIIRVIWIMCFLASASYCTYELVIAILTYLKFDVISSSITIYEAPTLFPAVDFCNLIPYKAYSVEREITNILSKYNAFPTNFSNSKNYTDTTSDLIRSNLAKLAINKSFNLFKNGYKLENMLISCYYERKSCALKDFYYFNDYNYGNCFSFNLGKTNEAGNSNISNKEILPANFPGADDGLQLELYVGNIYNQQYSYKSGIRLNVHNQSILSFPKDEGINVPTGLQTDIVIKRTIISHLSSPYSNCLKDPVDYTQNVILKTMLNNFTSATSVYKQSYCLKVCLQQYIINYCGCYDYSFPILNTTNLRGCFELNEIDCIRSTYLKYIKNNQDNYCYAMCPIECNEIQYDLQISTSSYPTEWYSNLMKNDMNFIELVNSTQPFRNYSLDYSFLKQNTLLVNVFYDKMLYTSISETPSMTVDTLIATFGGNLGLFLGVTVLSLVETFEIIFNIIYLKVKKIMKIK